MRNIALASLGIATAALVFTPPANADPMYPQMVRILTPPEMVCEIHGPNDVNRGTPSVDCQGRFATSPMDQAWVKDTGEFTYLNANLGLVNAHPLVLVMGQTYHIQSWTVVQSAGSATFTSDVTGHGMTISVDPTKGPQGQEKADVRAF